MSKTFTIIGAGAAGIFAAIHAAENNPSLKVIVLEKTSKLLAKVRISGGGRCNVTHACYDIVEMSKRYPRGSNFVKKTFHRFFTTDTIKWYEDRGVKLKAEEDGRMFPITDSSQSIIDCLVREVNRLGIEIRMNADVKEILYEEGKFRISLADRRELKSDFVCVACGGFPKASMFDWLIRTGHTIEDPVPSLFTFNLPSHPITTLMGVSVGHAQVKIVGSKLESGGPLLITHWGLSGPAVLRLSAWAARVLAASSWRFKIIVNWMGEMNEKDLRDNFQFRRLNEAAHKVKGKNTLGLPQRLWEFFCDDAGINDITRWADLKSKDENRLIRNLTTCEFSVEGKTTFKEEFVTAGGIQLSEIDAQSMMSKLCPNLFFAGEILNVDGITGGYNFQHAWTSGFIAGTSVGKFSIQE